ncbi:MAG: Lsm family RNA-binding protein [Candidatus Thorarchaeota archaeon]
MSLAGVAKRNYQKEITAFTNRRVAIILKNGKKYTGELKGINPETLTTVLIKAKRDDDATEIHRICLNGDQLAEIYLEEAPFDLLGLKEELEQIFRRPGDVKLFEEAGLLVILERVKVSESGVEGAGPVADRVRAIYNRYASMREEEKE